jgi:RimJ/RimL family protein N-acetyltransferase
LAKIRYEIVLRQRSGGDEQPVEGIRPISPDDLEALAALMLDAYIGTIDYEGEDLQDAVDEVGEYLKGMPLLDHSYAVEVDGDLSSAVLVTLIEDRPFIGYVMTRAAHKNHGLARTVTSHALASLARAGHDKVVFYVTDGNRPSEALFRSLGATPVPEDR